jgi:hypothetical protein
VKNRAHVPLYFKVLETLKHGNFDESVSTSSDSTTSKQPQHFCVVDIEIDNAVGVQITEVGVSIDGDKPNDEGDALGDANVATHKLDV